MLCFPVMFQCSWIFSSYQNGGLGNGTDGLLLNLALVVTIKSVTDVKTLYTE